MRKILRSKFSNGPAISRFSVDVRPTWSHCAHCLFPFPFDVLLRKGIRALIGALRIGKIDTRSRQFFPARDFLHLAIYATDIDTLRLHGPVDLDSDSLIFFHAVGFFISLVSSIPLIVSLHRSRPSESNRSFLLQVFFSRLQFSFVLLVSELAGPRSYLILYNIPVRGDCLRIISTSLAIARIMNTKSVETFQLILIFLRGPGESRVVASVFRA